MLTFPYVKYKKTCQPHVKKRPIYFLNLCFPKSCCKKLCKTGANTQGSLKKLAAFHKFELFRENSKTLVAFAKLFTKTQIVGRFLQNEIFLVKMKKGIFFSTLGATDFSTGSYILPVLLGRGRRNTSGRRYIESVRGWSMARTPALSKLGRK